jgi:hypothetical protein
MKIDERFEVMKEQLNKNAINELVNSLNFFTLRLTALTVLLSHSLKYGMESAEVSVGSIITLENRLPLIGIYGHAGHSEMTEIDIIHDSVRVGWKLMLLQDMNILTV